jgi:hypothetical protein
LVIAMSTVATEKQVDAIRAAALDEGELLKRAAVDCADALLRFAAVGRTTSESIKLLAHWQGIFQKLGDQHERLPKP